MKLLVQGALQENELKRTKLQSAIDGTKTVGERNRLGQFATPFPLALEIAQFVKLVLPPSTGPLRFADPSIGTGSFFSACLAALGSDRLESALGVEIDPVFARAAEDLWAADGLQIVQGDFTQVIGTGRLPAPNFLLANPPYVRHHHLASEYKERLQRLVRRILGIEVSGLAGLYVYFLLLATAWMEDGGIAAWLIPSEFMDVNYGSAVKRFLCDQVTLLRIHRFAADDVQFADALVSSVVLVLQKTPPPADHQIEVSLGGKLQEPRVTARVAVDRLREAHKWTRFPEHAHNDRFALSAQAGPQLTDLFRIQRGIATGDNKFFILQREDVQRLDLPPEFLRPVLPSPRFLQDLTIDADRDGSPLTHPQLCLIACGLPEQVVRQNYPSLWRYFQTASERGVLDRYLVQKRTPWYKQEHRDPSPFLCTYMGRGGKDQRPFRFFRNRSDAIATNQYLMLYPKFRLADMLHETPAMAEEVHQILCQIRGNELRGEGRVYGGGLNKIEPGELGRVSAQPLLDRWPDLCDTPLVQLQLL